MLRLELAAARALLPARPAEGDTAEAPEVGPAEVGPAEAGPAEVGAAVLAAGEPVPTELDAEGFTDPKTPPVPGIGADFAYPPAPAGPAPVGPAPAGPAPAGLGAVDAGGGLGGGAEARGVAAENSRPTVLLTGSRRAGLGSVTSSVGGPANK